MISFFKKIKNLVSYKLKAYKLTRGMSYIELFVVLSLFLIVSGAALFNYKQFQAKVDIKNFANDVALKVVETQKLALAGKWDSTASTGWKPSYGLYFNTGASDRFISFTDLNSSDFCDNPSSNCTPPYSIGGEVKSIINITKGNTISGIEISGSGCPATVTNLNIVFRRPSYSPIFGSSGPSLGCTPSSIAVNIVSPQGITGKIRVYNSGRIQIN